MTKFEEVRKRVQIAHEAKSGALNLSNLSLTTIPNDLALPHSISSVDLSGNLLSILPNWLSQFPSLTSLNVRENRLSTLPDWMSQLTNLDTLDIGSNRLHALPESISQLTSLTTIKIDDNKLDALPDWLSRLSKLTTVNVAGNWLSTLPEWMSQLTNLDTLDIGSNRLHAIPEWISQLTELTTLRFNNNRLHALPEWISQLTNLDTLDIGSNRLHALPDWLSQLTHLTTLNIDDNKLDALPDRLGQLINLDTLDIGSNRLHALPDWLSQLTHLTILNISGNRLHALPDWLSQLTHLTTLNISRNRLHALPDWLGQLNNLTTIDASRNRLDALPDSLRQLTNLTTLDIGSNRLSTLPDWMSQLTNLTTLRLNNNRLDALPDTLSQLTNLANFDIDRNRLSALPDWLGQLINLTNLTIGSNQLQALPGSLGELTNLTTLNIGRNRLSILPEWLGQLTNLTNLGLSDSQLDAVPEWLSHLTSLTELDLHNNQLDALPNTFVNLTNLTTLRLNNNRLHVLPEWLGQLTNLTSLTIGSNRFGALPDFLGQLTNLTTLDVDGNQLSTLPDSLSRLINLTELNIGSNQLSALPDWLGQLTELNSLFVWNNQLSVLPDSLRHLTNLTSLFLWNNKLNDLPEWLGELTKLRTLDLEGNPIKALPQWIARLTDLKTLYLNGMGIEALPRQLIELKDLEFLSIAENQLSALPDWLPDLRNLTTLQVGNNKLTELPMRLSTLNDLTYLGLGSNQFHTLPDWLSRLTNLIYLDLTNTQLNALPSWLGQLTNLNVLNVSNNQIDALPDWLNQLTELSSLFLNKNRLSHITNGIFELAQLVNLDLSENQLNQLPVEFTQLRELTNIDLRKNLLTRITPALALWPAGTLNIDDNPLSPELRAANAEGSTELHQYLRLLRDEGVQISEAKLVLVGEGGAGKSSLLAAMRKDNWIDDRVTTHGIEVKEVRACSSNRTVVTLNAWDFGGQPDYRPTHQLFFTAPAIYVVVWSPRRGPEVSYVDYWIEQIRLRAGDDVRVHVVATHADTGHRGAWIDEAALRRRFGEMLIGFHHIDSRTTTGIKELMEAIADTAVAIPHTSREYPASWMTMRQSIRDSGTAYLPYTEYCDLAQVHGLSTTSARSLALSCNDLGHWIYYADDPQLADVITFKPDWLSTAVSFVLDDPVTRTNNGLLAHRRVSVIWSDTKRQDQYPASLHPIFLYLMERFDISYRITDIAPAAEPTSLVTQLVSSTQPSIEDAWESYGNDWAEKTQICEIVDRYDTQTMPTGLMYRLIVRLHRYSLGREDYSHSRHWQTGLLIEDSLYGRALVIEQHKRLTVTVRSIFPPLLLDLVTRAIRELVSDLWPALRVRVLVPCGTDCPKSQPGSGIFDIEALVEAKKEGLPKCPCRVCNKYLPIDPLLTGGDALPAGVDRVSEAVNSALRPAFDTWAELILQNVDQIVSVSVTRQEKLLGQIREDIGDVSRNVLEAMGKVEQHYRELIYSLDDDARDGPRLFTVDRLDRDLLHPDVTRIRLRVTLWCEHSRLPVYVLSESKGLNGVYDLSMPREWVRKSAPWFRAVSVVLRTILPVAAGVTDLVAPNQQSWQSALGKQLEHAGDGVEALYDEALRLEGTSSSENRNTIGASARIEMDQSLVKALRQEIARIDSTFAGLVRVRADGGYRWVHRRFESIYRPGLPEVPR
ncbi:leucine-rich repeat domain-containing protein [Actinoplanes solisilvae]|uniref:leucine-rich repeat domain-containing protein n=1 Tax=Actinoplanes solisilvae TaxID=2486853 RepID=UPI000FDCD295|nr:leucine-rich repeat domain-containing protein [Actinoplanes solisilvae]